MNKHVELCITYFEDLERLNLIQAENYHARAEAEDPAGLWYAEYRDAKARAAAFRTCINALKDPKFFTLPKY